MAAPNQVTEAQILNGVVAKLMGGKRRQGFLKLVKEEFPDAPIPEIDVAAPHVAELGEVRTELAKVREAIAERDKQDKLAADLIRVQRARGYMDDALPELAKIMKEKGITDVDIAADHFDAEAGRKAPPPVAPVTTGFGRQRSFNPTADETTKKWFTDPDGMMEETINEIYAERARGQLVA